jgi:hypothetical protein
LSAPAPPRALSPIDSRTLPPAHRQTTPLHKQNRTWLLAALALAAVVLLLAAAPAAAAPSKAAPSAVEQYTALAKEYVAKAQKLAEEVAATAQETVSVSLLWWVGGGVDEMGQKKGNRAFFLLTARRLSPARLTLPLFCSRRHTKTITNPRPTTLNEQAEQYVKQANEYVQDAIEKISAKKTEL